MVTKIGPPSQQEFEHILKEKISTKFPLTVADIKRAVNIFVLEVYLQGKTVKKRGWFAPNFVPINMVSETLGKH